MACVNTVAGHFVLHRYMYVRLKRSYQHPLLAYERIAMSKGVRYIVLSYLTYVFNMKLCLSPVPFNLI